MTLAGPTKGLIAFLAGVPGIALGFLAVPHFQNGAALDSAIPVPNYIIRQMPMPVAAYRRAANALLRANNQDGGAQVALAEASIDAGNTAASQLERLERGVRDAPTVPRGWLLLSTSLVTIDKTRAATALSQALLLAPYDFWLAGSRAQEAAQQWRDLDPGTRALALRQAQLLWDDEELRMYIPMLLSSPEGVALLTQAFSKRPDDLRAINRWLSRELRRAADPEQ
ncbi:MAG: hypothetical protein WDM86_07440 [Rhizomicrobium sp.]